MVQRRAGFPGAAGSGVLGSFPGGAREARGGVHAAVAEAAPSWPGQLRSLGSHFGSGAGAGVHPAASSTALQPKGLGSLSAP